MAPLPRTLELHRVMLRAVRHNQIDFFFRQTRGTRNEACCWLFEPDLPANREPSAQPITKFVLKSALVINLELAPGQSSKELLNNGGYGLEHDYLQTSLSRSLPDIGFLHCAAPNAVRKPRHGGDHSNPAKVARRVSNLPTPAEDSPLRGKNRPIAFIGADERHPSSDSSTDKRLLTDVRRNSV
jgi:hypothetical protein